MTNERDTQEKGFWGELGETLKAAGRGWLGFYKGLGNLGMSAAPVGMAVYEDVSSRKQARQTAEARSYCGEQREDETPEAYAQRVDKAKKDEAKGIKETREEIKKRLQDEEARIIVLGEEKLARGECFGSRALAYLEAKREIYAGPRKSDESPEQYKSRVLEAMSKSLGEAGKLLEPGYKETKEDYAQRIDQMAEEIIKEEKRKGVLKGLERTITRNATRDAPEFAITGLVAALKLQREQELLRTQILAQMEAAFRFGKMGGETINLGGTK